MVFLPVEHYSNAMSKGKDVRNLQGNNVNNMMKYMVVSWMNNLKRILTRMRILRKGKELLEIFRCKLGYHEWVAVHWTEFLNRDLVGQFF